VSIVAALTVPYWLDSPARRHPPLERDEMVDVAVVGGGVSGLSCARVLADAGLRVRVLEARQVGSGASGRNGGFVLRGLAAPYSTLRAPELWRLTEEGVERVAALAGDIFRRSGHLHLVAPDEREDVLAERNALAADGFAAEWLEADELPPAVRGQYAGGLSDAQAGAVEPGRWARLVADHASAAGAVLAEESRVIELKGTQLRTAAATVTAERVVVATDGYTHGLLPELDELVRPARNQVAATAPLADRYFEPTMSARAGYAYWQQTVGRRIVAGGWRDVALEDEFTREEAVTPVVQDAMETFLTGILGRAPEITHRWAGLLGFTPDHLPLVGELPAHPGVWTALGYSGHGNVLALVCGEAVAHALLGEPDPRLAAFSPGRFPALRAPA
jgi:gamma-glutamylputrescine oxidase